MTDPFDSPGGGGNVDWADHLGKLLLIWPVGKEEVETKNFGKKEAIRADMVVLGGENEELPDILIFPLFMLGQLRRKMGKIVLGRLGKDEDEVDSKGRVLKQGAWKLIDPTDADKDTARSYLAKRQPKPAKADDKYDDVPF